MTNTELGSDASERRSEWILRPDGARIYTTCAGRGPSVVLAHGYLLDQALYDVLARRLRERGYRVIAFDQRGHGQSTVGSGDLGSATLASDYHAVLEHYRVEGGTLIAHSMGGFLALVFCLREPEVAARHLKRLILLGATAGSVAKGSLNNRLQIPLLRSGLLRRAWQRPRLGRAFIGQLFGPEPIADWIEATRVMLLRQHEEHSWPMLNALLFEDYYDRLREIPLPVDVICGEADRTCPRWHSERLGAGLPHARNLWLPAVGHMTPLEAPDAIVGALAADPPA